MNNKTIGSIESFTGGMFASKIVDKEGASKYFKGGIITYSNQLKKKFGINIDNGVINKETALMMAKVGKKILDVDICVSFTGNAGPTSMEGKKVGNVFISVNDSVYELDLNGSRDSIRRQAVDFALIKISKWID